MQIAQSVLHPQRSLSHGHDGMSLFQLEVAPALPVVQSERQAPLQPAPGNQLPPITFELLAIWDPHFRRVDQPDNFHIVTWFLKQGTCEFCDAPRLVKLNSQWHSWHLHLPEAWNDLRDPDADAQFVRVSFRRLPPEVELGHFVHVIIVQGERTLNAVLTMGYDENRPSLMHKFRAHFLPAFYSKMDVVAACGLDLECPFAFASDSCRVWHNRAEIVRNVGFRSRDGIFHVIVVHRRNPAECADEDDATSWMQLSGSASSSSSEQTFPSDASFCHIPDFTFSDQEIAALHPTLRALAKCWDVTCGMEEDGGIRFYIWYLQGATDTECHRSRIVTLPRNPDQWYDVLKQTWLDRINDRYILDFRLVDPHPPDSDVDLMMGGHIVLYQNLVRETNAVLLSLDRSDLQQGEVRHFARIVPSWCHFYHIKRWWRVEEICQDESNRVCTVCTSPHELSTDSAFAVSNAQSIYVLIQTLQMRRDDLAHRTALESRNIDRNSPASPDGQIEPHAQAAPSSSEHPEPDLDQQTFFTQILHTQWKRRAMVDPDGGRRASVHTWFLDHMRQPECRHSRTVQLNHEFRTWENQILAAWSDLVDPLIENELYLVLPEPPGTATPNCGHVIVAQRILFTRSV